MAGLDTLIRVRQHNIDELRRELAQIYEERDRVDNQIAELDNEYTRERQLIDIHPEFAFNFARYQARYRQRRAALVHAREELAARASAKLEAIREGFQDLKQLEITKRQREEAEAAEAARAEQRSQDETGGEMFRRQSGSDL